MNSEPIPGATPPDISKPTPPVEPGPPTPEAPKGGLKVEARQPEILYGVAKNIVDGTDRFSRDVSYTPIDDSLIKSESSELSGFDVKHEGGERIAGTFHYRSNIYLSDDRVSRPDHGYYSYEKVRGIQESLQQRGVKATLDHDRGGAAVEAQLLSKKMDII